MAIFPAPTVHLTTNADSAAKTSTFTSPFTPPVQAMGPKTNLGYIYSTLPALTLTKDADLTHSSAVAAAGPPFKFFPGEGASAIAYLDIAANPEQEDGFWHRTQTVDYIVLLEGELELSLDGGESRLIKKGDVVVQRAPMHKWKNLSKTEGARMLTVSLGVQGAVEGNMEFPTGGPE